MFVYLKMLPMILVSEEIAHFQQWCKTHRMSVNLTNSRIMNVNFGHNPLALIQDFRNVTVLKFLVLVFKDRFTLSDHIDFIVKKLSQRIFVPRSRKSAFLSNFFTSSDFHLGVSFLLFFQ